MIETSAVAKPRQGLTDARKGLLEKRLRNALAGGAKIASIPRRPDPAAAPLSYSQQRLWFIDQVEPGSPAYHVATALRLTGTLDVAAVERSLNKLVERHEMLRTSFPAVDGSPVQAIGPVPRIELPVVDLSQLPQDEREREARQRLKEAAQKPFNLAAVPLMRVMLVRLAEQDHLLLVVMHHIISDGWSVGVFFRELESIYKAEGDRASTPLPSLDVQYGDYASWQQQNLSATNLEEHLQWWKANLEHAPASLSLPTDTDRPEDVSLLRGSDKPLVIPETLYKQLAVTSRAQSVTPFMALLSALVITLQRWSRQTDLVLGTVVAGRTCREVENLIGCFMNFLPIRTRFAGTETGIDVLNQVKNAVLEAYAHQDCPFDKIVEAINPNRQLNQNPLYNVGFLLQNYPRNVFKTAELTGSMQTVRTDTALLDLRFVAEESDGALTLHCEYDTGLFQPQTIDFLLESIRTVLERLIENPATPLAQFEPTQELKKQFEAAEARKQAQTIAIAGTFTCEPITDSLQFWMEKLELPVVPRFAAYNQVFQELLDPGSLLSSNGRGLNVLLLRLQDWLGGLAGSTAEGTHQAQDHLSQTAAQLVDGLKRATTRNATPFLVCFCPQSGASRINSALTRILAATEEALLVELSAITGVHVLNATELFKLYPVPEYDDPQGDELGHVPYTPEFFAALGTMIVRKFHALKRPPRKVIALDCDQTLWNGVCGEDGAANIRIDAPHRALQQFMRAQMDAGALLCLCSKNNPEDVEAVFQLQQMPLKRSDFAAVRLNWRSKSQNLQALARELNLGLDSFIFVDDNPVECAEVEANCPEVLVIQLPTELDSLDRFLAHAWIFDHAKLTEEDRKRTALYLQNRRRQQFQEQATNFSDFISGLNLQIQIQQAQPDQLARVAQLTERTNQFNFTTRRRTEAEIVNLSRENKLRILAINVTDRFGDYGLVGVVIYELSRTALDVDTFLLSCRVLGKGVEHRILSHLGDLVKSLGRQWVDIHFIHTPKNKPAFDFLEKIGSSFRHGSNGSTLFRFPADFAASVVFAPDTAGQTVAVAQREKSSNSTVAGPAFAARFRSCRWIATHAWDPVSILNQIETHSIGQPNELRPYSAPRNEIEQKMCDLWQRLLRVERVGIHDDFFALGGTSLLAVRLFAQLEKETGKKLPVVTLFRAPTVDQLATLVSRRKAESTSALVALQARGHKPPLVLIHGAGGGILWGYANLAGALPPDQPVYAIDPRWTAGVAETHVEDMAERYIKELRTLQPRGPYRLGGYCFGGYVAYEMARQLHAAGERTALLLLIDCAAPNGEYDRIAFWQPLFLPRFIRNSIYWVHDFMRLPAAERREILVRKFGVLKRSLAERTSPSGRTVIDVEEFIDTSQFPEDEVRLWQVHLKAGSRFVPRPYAGRVTLLRTRRHPFFCSFDPRFGWSGLAQGGLDIHIIPGSHEAIFVEPDVTVLAARVNTCLEVAEKHDT